MPRYALPAQIVVDDALTPAQVADLNALYDAVLAGDAEVADAIVLR